MEKLKRKGMMKYHIQLIWKNFCESTSLHGYSNLYNASSIVLKLFWLFVILTMTAFGIILLVHNTEDYSKATIVTTIESSSAPLHVSH